MTIPKRIANCPILEALAELRFEPSVPEDAVFGLVYNAVRADFPTVENLPASQIPDFVKNVDPNLKFAPHYKMTKGDFIFQIGPRAVSLSNANKYAGWDVFSKNIYHMIDKMLSANVLKSISRIGLRYINYFPQNIFDSSNLCFSLGEKQLGQFNSTITTEIQDGEFTNVLRVSNNAQLQMQAKQISGSVVDIDTVMAGQIEVDRETLIRVIENAHVAEKKLFFTFLRPDFIETLSPEY